MTDTKAVHTPGPAVVGKLRKVRSMREGRPCLVDAENKILAVAMVQDKENGERLDALVAMSEQHADLLAACEALIDAAQYLPPVIDSGLADAINKADAAIAKAKGGTT